MSLKYEPSSEPPMACVHWSAQDSGHRIRVPGFGFRVSGAFRDAPVLLLTPVPWQAVVFDFDCTITIKHSGGRVRKDKLDSYLQVWKTQRFADVSGTNLWTRRY